MHLFKRHSHLIILLVIVFLSSQNISAKIYKWVDENGITHYGQRAVSGIDQKEISDQIINSVKPATKSGTTHTGTANLSDQPRKKQQRLKIDLKMINYDMDKKIRKKIKGQIRTIYQTYIDWFKWKIQENQDIKIRIFGVYEDFEKYQIKYNGKFLTNRSHYNSARREILMHGTEFQANTLRVLFHETSHAILHMGVNYAPKWINEGLAEVFERAQIHKGSLKITNNGEWIERIKLQLQEGSLLSFAQYININTDDWHNTSQREEQAYYYIAWSMMRFLTINEKNQRILKHILNDTQHIPWWNAKELEGIFDARYPGGIKKLNQDWRRWIVKS